MKKIHLLGIAILSMLVVGVVSVASASAIEWLEDGAKMTAASASETTGELLFRNTNGGGLGLSIDVLCSWTFDGTVGPGAADTFTKILTLTGVETTLAAPLTCTDVENCESPLVSAVNLPWKTELELMETGGVQLFLDKLFSSGAGNPGWEIDCITIFGLIEETCQGPTSSDLVNDAAENDVLFEINESENIAGGEQFTCSGGGGKTGTTETDGPELIFLTNGLTLAVSE